ncbi:DUF2852 domain-containing protein [Paracoccus sp. (in: a-proteobacteria)]|uniref:DUF2852 domain-containing protein n=1 Tax=Paracoccus sp. TaxID=267 RepID=UPI00289A1CB3|nr:DUF2852 domain-containing protein [Paracoccus sp. (in: a-proteobacteria)]
MNIPASDWSRSSGPGVLAPVLRVRDWLDARGKPAWIIAMILGFVLAWPVGLGLLGYMIWSKRMFCSQRKSDSRGFGRSLSQPTGNSAFDAYREETLKRLEDEHEQFVGFLHKLREAKDKAEFDDFMRSRQNQVTEV